MEDSTVSSRRESPVLNVRTFQEFTGEKYEQGMTFIGVVNKTSILLMIVAVSAAWGWLSTAHDVGFSGIPKWIVLVVGVAFIVGLITSLRMDVAPISAPLYACLEGFVLGVLSTVFEVDYPGLVIQAVFLTFGTLLGLLVVYRVSGFRVSAKFRTGVFAAMLAILLVYLANIILHFFGMGSIPYIHQGDFIGIYLSLFMVGIAALNMVLDFDLIDKGVRQGAPKYMEWYAAFGLMVTLIWLYLEILKVLIQIAVEKDDD